MTDTLTNVRGVVLWGPAAPSRYGKTARQYRAARRKWRRERRPARVLRECAAKRRIMDLVDDLAAFADEIGETLTVDAFLKDLASVYADHPDYREEWKR